MSKMEKPDFKTVMKPAVILTIICVVSAALLGLSNMLTENQIATLAEKNKAASMQKVLSADEYNKVDGDAEFYTAIKSGKEIGYVASTSAKGYGGEIGVMVGMDLNGNITAIDIVSCDDETPGLGQNVKSDDFKARFKNVSKKATIGDNIDGWTGATISSKGVAAAVNQAFKLYKQYK